MKGDHEEKDALSKLVAQALREDLGSGDVTAKTLVPPRLRGRGALVAKAEGIVSGLEAARRVFCKVDPKVRAECRVSEGALVASGKEIMIVEGRAVSLLKAERTALNFLQHLSGIATLTSRYMKAVSGTNAQILDTRKTLPGLRALEKAAVRAGGGTNHRMGLYDMILIKDNHLTVLDGEDEVRAVAAATSRALEGAPPGIRVQVEVTSVASALEAGRCGAHMVLLDNMTPDEMAEVMDALQKEFGDRRPLVEASGGINLDNIRQVAASGVDRISVGALTHSAPALDIAMYIRFDN